MLARGVCSVCNAGQTTWGLWCTSGTVRSFIQITSGFLCHLSFHTDIHRSSCDSINSTLYCVTRRNDQILYQGSACAWTQQTCCRLLFLLELLSIITFISNISHCCCKYASKDCFQKSKFRLYVSLLQVSKSIMARWFWRNLLLFLIKAV